MFLKQNIQVSWVIWLFARCQQEMREIVNLAFLAMLTWILDGGGGGAIKLDMVSGI